MDTFGRRSADDPNRYTPAMTRLLRQLRAGTSNADDFIAIGRRVLELFPPQPNPDDTIVAYLSAAGTLAEIVETRPELNETAAHLITTLAQMYVWYLPGDKETQIKLIGLEQKLAHTLKSGTWDERVYANRHAMACTELTTGHSTTFRNVTGLRSDVAGTNEWGLSDRKIRDYQERAEELASYISQQQKYGVKSCFIADGIMHSHRTAWVCLDGYEQLSQFPESNHASMRFPMALVHLAIRNKLHKISISFKENSGGQTTFTPDYPRVLGFAVQRNGTLTDDSIQGIRPLVRTFQLAGIGDLYPLFWFTQLLRLADLVIPIHVRKQLGITGWPQMSELRREADEHRRKIPQALPKLYLPRLKAMALGPQLTREIEFEVVSDMARSAPSSRKAPEQVIGFFRPLPEGHRASPEAIANALREKDRRPEPGETYVKARGKSEGHEVRRRQR